MPAVTHSRQTSVSIEELWDHVHDLSNWAADIPGYVTHTEVDPNESIWTVKGDIGALSKTVDFRVRVTERVAPSRVTFRLEGTTENLTGQGSFEARPVGPARPLTVAPEPAPVIRGWRAALQRVMQRLFRRNFVSLQQPGSPAAPPASPAAGPATEFSFSLELRAGGMMGPVVNALLEPLLLPAAVDLADKIAGSVEDR